MKKCGLFFLICTLNICRQFFAAFSPPSRRSAKKAAQDDQHSSHATLYIIVIACALLIVATIIGVAIVLYRRYKKDHGKLDLTSASTQESFRERLGNTKRRSCELVFLAKEKSGCYKQRYEPTTSARLFSIHSNDGGESCTEVGDMDGFASYVKVRKALFRLYTTLQIRRLYFIPIEK